MANPFLGEIRIVGFNFAPLGWLDCAGQLLSIAQNDALFNLIGTMYGGDGQSTFALPDLRSRVAVGVGTGPGLAPVVVGEMSGVETVTLTVSQIPQHTHVFPATGGPGTTTDPQGGVYATIPNATKSDKLYGSASESLGAGTMVAASGGSQPHSNLMPYLGLRFVIAVEGIFPSP